MIMFSRRNRRAQSPPPETIAAPPRPADHPAQRGPVSNQFALLLGQTGMGKTTYMVAAYRAAVEAGRDCTFVNSKCDPEYRTLGQVVRSPAEWAAHALAARREGRTFSLVIEPSRSMLPDDWAPVWALIYEAGHILVAMDEADLWAPPSKGHVPRDLQTLISWGRSRRVDMIASVRLYSEVSELLKANAHTVITFRQPDAYYAKITNDRYFRLATYEILMRLPRFHYLKVDTATGSISRGRTRLP